MANILETILHIVTFDGLKHYDEKIKGYVDDKVSSISSGSSVALDAEIERATSAEEALQEQIDSLPVDTLVVEYVDDIISGISNDNEIIIIKEGEDCNLSDLYIEYSLNNKLIFCEGTYHNGIYQLQSISPTDRYNDYTAIFNSVSLNYSSKSKIRIFTITKNDFSESAHWSYSEKNLMTITNINEETESGLTWNIEINDDNTITKYNKDSEIDTLNISGENTHGCITYVKFLSSDSGCTINLGTNLKLATNTPSIVGNTLYLLKINENIVSVDSYVTM